MLNGTSGREHELKGQGAIEAARDPNSSVNAQQAEDALVAHAQAGGAAAFQFDPDATPEQKAAQAKEHLQVQRPHRKHQTAALVTDADDGEDAGYDLPPPSKEGVMVPATPTTPTANRAFSAEEEEQYKKTGWAPRFGNPADHHEGGTMLDHQTFLEGKLDDKFFGDWYHNAGVIIFACLSSWTVAVLGGGLGWVFLIMAACGTYYRTSLRRVRRNFRDDVNRDLAKNKLETDTESLEWINSFMAKFWPIYAPVICATIITSVDQVLSTSTPAFLDSMRMKSFTLGTKPPRMEHVKTYPRSEDDIVMMDWKFSFTPNDTSDLTASQKKNKINPKVVLEVRVGKAMISKGLDIIVEDMACSGIMRVKMKLQIPFPHIDRVEICFLGRPTFDYVCKPIGGDMLGFDINFVPGLESFIQEQIHANLAPMMYEPNVFPIEIAKMLAGNPVDQAIGVLQVQFHGAQGLKNPDKFSGTPDPYAVVCINGREALGKTKTVPQNANPRWGETVNVILTSLREPLEIQIYDYNEFRKDKELGKASFNLEQFTEGANEFENQTLEVIANGRARGVVQCDVRFFPVLEGQKLEDGTVEPPPESTTGIAKFTVEQAKELDGSPNSTNPYAVLLLNGKEVQISRKLKRTVNPIWDNATKELLITDRKKAKLGLVIKDDTDLGKDPIIGSYQIKLDDMLDLTTKGQEWYHLAGVKTGRAKMMLQWKPVALKNALGGSGYVTPIGVMRFHFQSAKDLKNLDTVGKSDPYARVLLSGVQKGRTVTWKNNLNPDFDEVFYVPVHSTREKLVVEVMDEENTQKDRTLGQMEVATSDYIFMDEKGDYQVNDSKTRVISAPLRIGTSAPKGTLNFTVAFYPTLQVLDPEEEEREGTKSRGSVEVNGSRNSLEVPKTPTTPASAVASGPRAKRSNTAGTITSLTSVSPEVLEMQKALTQNEGQQMETKEVQEASISKIRITANDLKDYETGLIIFTIHDGDLATNGSYLEVVMDDMRFPAYTSAKTRSGQHNFNETGDAVVRELDLSKITLRLVGKTDRKGDDLDEIVKSKLVHNTIDTLRRCLYTPTIISLKDENGQESHIKVSMKFLPIQMKLDPSESFNNQGNLRVEVLDAADLPAADRNGFSDPYCRFSLNGKEVFKTKTQKKTLHPAWNEFFEVPIRSRTAAKFEVKVYDWDFGDKADFLGAAAINLDLLEPFQAQEVSLGLDGKSGTIRLKMLFKPDYVTRSRQGSSTFSGTFAAPGKVIGAPVKGVGKAGMAIGGGVGKGLGFVGRGFKRRTVSGAPQTGDVEDMRDTSMEVSDSVSRPGTSAANNGLTDGTKDPPRTPQAAHQRQTSFGAYSQSPAPESGTANITVIGASGFDGDTKLEVHVHVDTGKGFKEVIKTKPAKAKTGECKFEEEAKRIPCSAATQFKVAVRNHKSFGGGEDLGESAFFINDQSGGGEQEINVGTGVVVIRTSFEPADVGSTLAPSESPGGSKRGFGRLMSRRERSVTPSAS